MAEHRTVDAMVVGSSPISHPVETPRYSRPRSFCFPPFHGFPLHHIIPAGDHLIAILELHQATIPFSSDKNLAGC